MSGSITFNGKEYALRPGKTSLSNLDTFFHATESTEYKKGIGHVISGINTESLTSLENIASNTDVWINESIRVVGMLLANTDNSNLDSFDLNNVGWLLAGISELKNALSDASTVIEQTKDALQKGGNDG